MSSSILLLGAKSVLTMSKKFKPVAVAGRSSISMDVILVKSVYTVSDVPEFSRLALIDALNKSSAISVVKRIRKKWSELLEFTSKDKTK